MPTSLTRLVLTCQRLFTLETCCGYGYGLARDLHLLARIFKGRRELTGRRRNRDAFQGAGPSLGTNPFQGALPFTKKRELFRGCRRLLRGRLRCRTGRLAAPVSAFQVRGSEPDSLSIGRGRRRPSPQPFRTAFAYPLGPTDPCSTAVHMEPFSTSAFKVLV